MGKIAVYATCIFTLFFVLQYACALEFESFLVDALDSTMLALKRDRATKDLTKRVVVSKVAPTYYRKNAKKAAAGRGWRGSRRRAYTKKTVVTKKKRIPLNKNLQAGNQIQNGMLEANAMTRSISNNKLQHHIKQACNAKQFIFARQMLGHNIYNAGKATSSRRGRRSVSTPAEIIKNIEKEIGPAKFNKLMAYDGGVTLAFALDTTGSMHDDISQAKNIIIGIIGIDRTFLVDYVLSPFNDPITDKYHGPLTYKDHTQKEQFKKIVLNVETDGGGDCNELAITGIKEIFSSSIQYQSPVYVLTDAGAKDATDESIETLKAMIDAYQSPVNFFLSTKGCLKGKDIELYKSLADFSGGQVLYFSNKKRIGLTEDLVKKGLIGGSSIPVIPNKRKRRGIGGKEFSILVDDSVETLSTTVLDTSSGNVLLYNPAGRLQSVGKVNTGKGALYLVEKPAVGLWKLVTSSNSFVTAKCISLENIDFEYNFLLQVKVGPRAKVISSKAPLQGKQATVIITVPAHAKTVPSSFKLKIVDVGLKTLRTVALKPHGKSGGRYKGSFPPPSHDFRLVLEGRTKINRPFSRLGTGIIKPKTVIIHVFSAPRGFAVTAGSRSPTTIIFALHNYGSRDVFEVKADEPKKFISRLPRRVFGLPGRMALFSLSFKAPGGSKRGQSHNVVVSVIGKKTGAKSKKHIQLLVI